MFDKGKRKEQCELNVKCKKKKKMQDWFVKDREINFSKGVVNFGRFEGIAKLQRKIYKA